MTGVQTCALPISEVLVILCDKSQLEDIGPAVLEVLFGTLADSGFDSIPAKGDEFQIADETYRVYDVKKDRPTASVQQAGLWIYLVSND